jgi:2-polyprenyl-3-methyl-5-hydroxy-6-metoxy-1,4-benzoquinol methylase
MDDCCDPKGYQAVFSSRFARRVAKRYSKRGLSPAASRMVGFVSEHGLKGATVLEIGGGIGELQVELLRCGAARVNNLEISTSYEAEARALLARSGLTERVTRGFGDIATSPELAEPADVVVMHRVVCCYPDYQLLLSVAANHARRLLVYSHPADNVVAKAIIGSENLARRLQRNPFRAFVHPPDAMVAAAEGDGLRTEYRHRAKDWQVVGLVR